MAGPEGPDTPLFCSFCDKSQEQVRKLVAGPTSRICDECIEICADIVSDDRIAKTPHAPHTNLTDPVPPIFTARCSLCRAAVVTGDLVAVIGRGSVCVSCIGAIHAIHLPTEPTNDGTQ